MVSDPAREPTSDQWRTFYAAERTLLAWVRTGLALMGFGFLVERFGLFLRHVAALRHDAAPPRGSGSVWFGVTLVLLGTVVMFVAARRHRSAVKRLAAGTELASSSATAAPICLAVVLAAFGVALAVYLLRLN